MPHSAPVLFTFRPLVDGDLPLLHAWLNEPGVVRWWEGDDVTWDGVVRDYGEANRDETEHWIAERDGTPIGWIQRWALAAAPEEIAAWLPLGIDETAAGIDYLVGEPGDRGRGIGSAMIRAFVADIVFGRHPHWTQACADPCLANEASWRALARAGFHYVGTYEDDDGPCRLMAVDRPDPASPSTG